MGSGIDDEDVAVIGSIGIFVLIAGEDEAGNVGRPGNVRFIKGAAGDGVQFLGRDLKQVQVIVLAVQITFHILFEVIAVNNYGLGRLRSGSCTGSRLRFVGIGLVFLTQYEGQFA